jgi:hypothetical protein
MAPFNAWPILFVTFPVLVWLVDGSAAGRWSGAWTAAAAGWCFGFGFFVAGLYWIGYAFRRIKPSAGCRRSRSRGCRPIRALHRVGVPAGSGRGSERLCAAATLTWRNGCAAICRGP